MSHSELQMVTFEPELVEAARLPESTRLLLIQQGLPGDGPENKLGIPATGKAYDAQQEAAKLRAYFLETDARSLAEEEQFWSVVLEQLEDELL
ncbi:hypothetical protein GCM10010912_37290 [Paenibacillus albidus]|uniref:Uncharacterized protein n=1 Tax=Paenibacillus albidus TaxID=2041023 RepID=A0A917CHG2_9BACL|nr:hypothetical protein [Paenibacillus albidus]GGF88640.1 hypothetical protein GCM10010912_37290 [Paenibacillus albidus]